MPRFRLSFVVPDKILRQGGHRGKNKKNQTEYKKVKISRKINRFFFSGVLFSRKNYS